MSFQFEFKRDSRTKLVCFKDKNPFTRYSFDGRRHVHSGKLRFSDDPAQFQLQRGITYLQNLFFEELAANGYDTVFIADADYPKKGEILFKYDRESNRFLHPSVFQNPTEQIVHKLEPPKDWIFKLWLPITGGDSVTFYSQMGVNVHTGEISERQAIISIVAQMLRFKETTKLKYQKSGQFYGDGKTLHSGYGNETKSFAYFDMETCRPYYHHSKKQLKCLEMALQM
jgi:hypothetical protein